jgi:hypothetical protein
LLNFNPDIVLEPLPNPPIEPFAPPPYYDVNGDGFASQIDAVLVINYLNGAGGAGSSGEGEGGLASRPGDSGDGASILVGTQLTVGGDVMSFDSPATEAVASVLDDELLDDEDDFGLTIGQPSDSRHTALESYLRSSAIEEALEEIADDISGSTDDELFEDLAVLELLYGKRNDG